MIRPETFSPASIVVIGASRDPSKIGGKILHNLLNSHFDGDLFAINPKESEILGVPCPPLAELPSCDLAIICVPAQFCEEYVTVLLQEKAVKAIIIVSAGFAESSAWGAALQQRLVDLADAHECTLIGPNCTGILTATYSGIFAGPIPPLDPAGCDFVSGSGATAAFVVEEGILQGLPFSRIVTVGNSAQTRVEDMLAYWDETYVPGKSARVKLIYMESVQDPGTLLSAASSLAAKGCILAAIKAGTSGAGQRAASSHTGALSSSDSFVSALMRRAGIVRCSSRYELIQTATAALIGTDLFTGIRKPSLPRFAIVTHAGGPGVILTDTLSAAGCEIPELSGKRFEELGSRLHPGSSVSNPIDFLATGTDGQLDDILTTLESSGTVDAAAVIFGSPGLNRVDAVYDVIGKAMRRAALPIFPVLPSPVTAEEEMQGFSETYRLPFFTDEAALGSAVKRLLPQRISNSSESLPTPPRQETAEDIRKIIAAAPEGYLDPGSCSRILALCGIATPAEHISTSADEITDFFRSAAGPVALKAVGPLHKSDSGGVLLNLASETAVREGVAVLMAKPETTAVLAQKMVGGVELCSGAVRDGPFGHLIMTGLGGIYVEVLKDLAEELVPVTREQAEQMLESLQSYPLLQGVRGKPGIDIGRFSSYIAAVSRLLEIAPEICELDINPLMAEGGSIAAVDARIRIER